MLREILLFLDGRKAIIGGAINAINAYFVTAGIYDANVGALIASLVLILTGVGIQQSNKMLGRAYRAK